MSARRKSNGKTSNHLELQLDGQVRVVEFGPDGREVDSSVIDGKVVLECLLHVIEESLRQVDDRPPERSRKRR